MSGRRITDILGQAGLARQAGLAGHARQVRQVRQAGLAGQAGRHLSLRAATPGRTRPPRNSSEAPPPVEIWVIRSAMPAFFTAAIESPPPMMVVPFTAATACATALVPAAK